MRRLLFLTTILMLPIFLISCQANRDPNAEVQTHRADPVQFSTKGRSPHLNRYTLSTMNPASEIIFPFNMQESNNLMVLSQWTNLIESSSGFPESLRITIWDQTNSREVCADPHVMPCDLIRYRDYFLKIQLNRISDRKKIEGLVLNFSVWKGSNDSARAVIFCENPAHQTRYELSNQGISKGGPQDAKLTPYFSLGSFPEDAWACGFQHLNLRTGSEGSRWTISDPQNTRFLLRRQYWEDNSDLVTEYHAEFSPDPNGSENFSLRCGKRQYSKLQPQVNVAQETLSVETPACSILVE